MQILGDCFCAGWLQHFMPPQVPRLHLLHSTVTMFYNNVTQRAVGEVVVEMAGVEGADAAAHDNHSRKD